MNRRAVAAREATARTVFEAGETFYTITADGVITMYLVGRDGSVNREGGSLLPEGWDDRLPHETWHDEEVPF